jgi:hypothetical protein
LNTIYTTISNPYRMVLSLYVNEKYKLDHENLKVKEIIDLAIIKNIPIKYFPKVSYN